MAALASKEAGNAAFGKKDYSTAAEAYASGLKELSAKGSYSDLQGADRELAATLLSNRAASLLGMEKYDEACEVMHCASDRMGGRAGGLAGGWSR